MKFSHSDRVLHDSNFNPPCNYYNLDKKEEKKVLTGTLAGPKLISDAKNIFGNSKRFANDKNSIAPGPGQYFQEKKEVVYNFKKDLSNPKEFLKNTFRTQEQNPSIPYRIIKEKNLNEQEKAFIKELSLQENPAKALQNTRKKDPSFSFSKSPRKILAQKDLSKKESSSQKSQTYCLQYNTQKKSQKQKLQAIKQKNHPVSQTAKIKTNLNTNETIRKASKKRNEIINNIGPDFVPSLELIDLMGKMRTKYGPGPGFYNPNNNSFTKQIDSLTESNNKGAIFTTVKRFNTDKKSLLGPGEYHINDESFSKKGGKFSKQKRAILNIRDKVDVEFRFYVSPNQREMNVHSRVQRSSSYSGFKNKNMSETDQGANGFGSSSKRFSTVSLPKVEIDKKSQPSEYEVQKMNNFKIQLKARMKKLKQEDRRSTKEDSGLLGISTMATLLD